MSTFNHEVRVVVNGKMFPGWKTYSIQSDILAPADSFSLTVQFSKEAWKHLEKDAPISIFLDNTRIMTGFIGSRRKMSGESGTEMEITGRDRAGRLVDESAPLFKYGGLELKDLAEKIIGIGSSDDPIFEEVIFSNAKNRSLLRNVRARQATIVDEPVTLKNTKVVFAERSNGTVDAFPVREDVVIPGAVTVKPAIIDPGIFRGRSAPKKVTPGMTRWQVLEEFIREARLLAWSTADGKSLYIGLPNYDQDPQYFFFEAEAGSPNMKQTNCSISITEDVEEMFSAYVCVGSSKGDSANYGKNVTKHMGVVFDNPEDTTDGTGLNFGKRKALIITDDGIKSQRHALERAERERLEREANFFAMEITTSGHSQLYSGEVPTIYAADTMAKVFDEPTGIAGDFYITSVAMECDGSSGSRTTLRLVRKGTVLSL